MTEENSLEKRVNALEGKLKKYAGIAALAGVLLGGGGVFGLAQWVYKAPLEKQVLKYESAMRSLDRAIDAANDSGVQEKVKSLRIELVSLDRSYRTALGLIEECMLVLSNSRVSDRDPRTKSWLKDASQELSRLRSEREPISEAGLSPSEST